MCKRNKMNGWNKAKFFHRGFGKLRKLAHAISDRVMRQYLANRSRKTALKMPYPIQYALELLAESAEALDQLAQTSEELGGY